MIVSTHKRGKAANTDMLPFLCRFRTLIKKILVNNFNREAIIYKICDSRAFRMYSRQLRDHLKCILFLIFRES